MTYMYEYSTYVKKDTGRSVHSLQRKCTVIVKVIGNDCWFSGSVFSSGSGNSCCLSSSMDDETLRSTQLGKDLYELYLKYDTMVERTATPKQAEFIRKHDLAIQKLMAADGIDRVQAELMLLTINGLLIDTDTSGMEHPYGMPWKLQLTDEGIARFKAELPNYK